MLTETRNYGENKLSPFVVGQNCVLWISLAARKTGKCSFAKGALSL